MVSTLQSLLSHGEILWLGILVGSTKKRWFKNRVKHKKKGHLHYELLVWIKPFLSFLGWVFWVCWYFFAINECWLSIFWGTQIRTEVEPRWGFSTGTLLKTSTPPKMLLICPQRIHILLILGMIDQTGRILNCIFKSFPLKFHGHHDLSAWNTRQHGNFAKGRRPEAQRCH